MSLAWNSWPCLGWEADVPTWGLLWPPSIPKLRFIPSQGCRSPVLSYSVPPATVDNIYCHNSSLSPWSWEWIWPLSYQQSQVSASQQMTAGRTSCRAWGPSLHNMEVHLPLIPHTQSYQCLAVLVSMGMTFIAPSQQPSPWGTGKLSITVFHTLKPLLFSSAALRLTCTLLTDTVDTHGCEGLCVPRVTVDMVFPIPGTLDICAR